MKQKSNFKLLTFYKFVDIENPRELTEQHRDFCVDIGLRGRIFIGEEGINATVSGNFGQIKAYLLYLKSIPEFRDIPDIEEKTTLVTEHQFNKMIVRYRREIVALGEIFKSSEIQQSTHKISVDEFKEVMENYRDDYVLLDMRNDYEYNLGHFRDAVPAGTIYFRELKDVLEDYKKQYSDKKIIMYCTGGIRCEKAGALLEREGIEGVFQLDGGVVKYVNKFNDKNWVGNLYTFDGRISTPVGDDSTHTIISKCHYSGEPAEEYFNCRFGKCNDQIISTEDKYKKYFGFCSEECKEKSLETLLIRNESFDKLNYKILRGQIKSYPEKHNEIAMIIRNNISKHLDGITIPVEKSRKLKVSG
ncbi:MAG: rhodanese-related sulfurtransferase [Candidatus Kapabacteria bacterium]|nr:rhodanese-related sulfurtransferase [Ignavibacteriota bacterium]MCW5885152.1 rhodanese-related sulfurtransferase [Candidatus Kapabacteria bacterium]